MTKGDKQYLPLLYLRGYDLSPLLYDINQQVTLLEQLVFLSGCINLDTRVDKRRSIGFVAHLPDRTL